MAVSCLTEGRCVVCGGNCGYPRGTVTATELRMRPEPPACEHAFKSLIRSIEAEGYEVLVDVDGTYSVRKRVD